MTISNQSNLERLAIAVPSILEILAIAVPLSFDSVAIYATSLKLGEGLKYTMSAV